MEIFGGFMVMMSILSFFMAIVWLIMPFVVFAIKGKLDKTLDVLAEVEKRLAKMEAKLEALQPEQHPAAVKSDDVASVPSNLEDPPRDASLPIA